MPAEPVDLGPAISSVASTQAFAEELYHRLRPWTGADPQLGWAWAHLCVAIAAQFSDVWEAARADPETGEPGWARMLDPMRCPIGVLPWLAQFKGTTVPAGLTEPQQRAHVLEAGGWDRGTVASLVRATRGSLDGGLDAYVNVVERVGDDPDQMLVVTRTSQTPDPALALRAIRAATVAGMNVTHEITDDPLLDEGEAEIDTVEATIDDAGIADVD